MIISDDREFAFIHIPKCAGTSVRRALRSIDTTNEAFFRIANHPALGAVHLAHLTLGDLAEHYLDAFDKVRRYRSVAIVRDPLERFTSAVFQRLREFKHVAQSAITPEVIDSEAEAVITYLERGSRRLDLHHVHFHRQSEFVELGGERIVDALFPVTCMAEAARHIRGLTGVDIGEDKRNPTTELRFASLRPVQRVLRDHYARLVPPERRARIRETMTRAGFYKEVSKQRFVEPGGHVERFVRDYYARDFEILRACERQLGARAA